MEGDYLGRIIPMEQQKFLIEMKDFQINKKARAFLLVMVFLPFAGLFGWVFWSSITDSRLPGESYLEDKVNIECQGVVFNIFRQKMNHNIQTLETEYCLFQLPAKWEDKFQINDSISKKEGEFFVEHYRNGKLIEVLDYHDVAKEMKWSF